jgi:hypothetical protein
MTRYGRGRCSSLQSDFLASRRISNLNLFENHSSASGRSKRHCSVHFRIRCGNSQEHWFSMSADGEMELVVFIQSSHCSKQIGYYRCEIHREGVYEGP